MILKSSKNLFDFDKNYGAEILLGTDEAGRGPGAGGVFASAVYFQNPDCDLIQELSLLNDSKKLSKKRREALYEIILRNTINSTVCVEVDEIEQINILNSSLKAMKIACENVLQKILSTKDTGAQKNNLTADLDSPHGHNILVLVDGNKLIKGFNTPQKIIIKGDSKSASIAAASILAKVTRDKYMDALDKKFPQYNWKKNAGYLTKEHLSAIDRYGITPIHRKSFLKKHMARHLAKINSD